MRSVFFLLFFAVVSLVAQNPAAKTRQQTHKAPAAQALPPDAPSREEILKLFDVLEIKKQMESVLGSMHKNMNQMMQDQGSELSPKQHDEIEKLMGEMYSRLSKSNFVSGTMEGMVPIYQRHFTKSDVNAVVAFYSSPAGQKMLHEQPLILQEYMPKAVAAAQAQLEIIMKQMNFEQRMKQILEEDQHLPGKPK
jgi:hypothetical protein